ncbi:MAG: hypothetical protein LGR52_00135 [Candidatus Thiosymbion ectosymbiont of Robbea hypermnestra]|nr:hypothetical protein [Candidatus Thiosymbion ectosymbiont of Robbea hypermnestra]
MHSTSQAVNVYIGNHGKKDGIEEYLVILKNVLSRHGYECRISTRYVPGIPNIVIDEFTNYLENRKLLEFRKKNPNTPLIFVLTEFVEKQWGVESLNHFEGIGSSALIALINVVLLIKRKELPSPGIKDWAVLFGYFPFLLMIGFSLGIKYLALRIKYLALRIKYLVLRVRQDTLPRRSLEGVTDSIEISRRKVYRLTYCHIRYHGLVNNLQYADFIITSHENIWSQMIKRGLVEEEDNRYGGVIYPEFDVKHVLNHLFVNKDKGIEITGTVSPYRRKWVKKVNREIIIYGLRHFFPLVRFIGWERDAGVEDADYFLNSLHQQVSRRNVRRKRAAFSLHPPQTRRWPYSSPTRIYRALQVDGNIPIITHYFGQSPIEDICLVYHGVDTLEHIIGLWEDCNSAREFVREKTEKYNSIASRNNDQLISRISEIF